jgi:hypothetical protein
MMHAQSISFLKEMDYSDFIIYLSVFCNKEMEKFAPTLSPNKEKQWMEFSRGLLMSKSQLKKRENLAYQH